MKERKKTKFIQKELRKNKANPSDANNKNKGEPELKSLSDFVTALKTTHTSTPIYTGGRIVQTQGKLFASCNQDVAVYDIGLRSSLPKIVIHNEEIVNFAVNSQGTKIATYSQNGLLRIMDTSSQTVIQITKMNAKLFPNDISFSKDSKYLAIGFASQMVKILTVETLKETHQYQHGAPVRKVEWNPNAEMLQVISSDYSKQITVFDYILNKVIAKVDGGHNFCFTTSGKDLVSIHDQEVRVYEIKGLVFKQGIKTDDYLESVYSCGDMVMFGGEETDLFVWEMGTEQMRGIRNGTESGVMKIVGWEKEKKFMVISSEQNITIIDSQKLIAEDIIVGYNDQIIDIKYSKGQESDFFLLITNSSHAKIMNRSTHALHCLIEGHKELILCGEYWHPWIITGGKDKIVKLWKINDVGKVKLVANYRGHSDDVCGLALMRQSHKFVSVGEDKTIKIWPLCQAAEDAIEIKSATATIMGHEKTINAVRVSPKDELIATCSHDRTVRVWDQQLRRLFVLTGHRRGVWDAAFHDKEALLITAGGDGMLKGWSMLDGSCVWSMGEGAGLVRCQWIYEHQVITGSVDGVLKLWDVRKKTSLSYDKHEGKMWALQVHKMANNKCEIATGANDSIYQIWQDSTEETRSKLLHESEQQEKERILLEQYRFNKEYLEASKIAFSENYTQSLIQIVEEMAGKLSTDRQIQLDEDGAIIEEEQQMDDEAVEQNIREFIRFASEKDLTRLLLLVLNMTSTVRHFKAANKLFIQILKQHKLRGLLKVNKSFTLPQQKEELDQKQTDFEKFLKAMLNYTQKHHTRIEKYMRGSYWIDHMKQLNDPFAI